MSDLISVHCTIARENYPAVDYNQDFSRAEERIPMPPKHTFTETQSYDNNSITLKVVSDANGKFTAFMTPTIDGKKGKPDGGDL